MKHETPVKWLMKKIRRYLYIMLMVIFSLRMIAYAIGDQELIIPEISSMEPVCADFPLEPCDKEFFKEHMPEQFEEEELPFETESLEKKKIAFELNDKVPLNEYEQETAQEIADNYGVQVELLYAIMYAESGYDSDACSYNGSSVGIMQINKINYGWLSDLLGINDLYDYRQNVTAGAFMISDLISRYGGYEKALICYKYGEAGAASLWEEGRSDTAYIDKIMGEYYKIKRQ